MAYHNQIFLDKSVPEIVSAAILDSGVLTSNDFEFRLTKTYPKREYVCQYRESYLDFISRWLEREGLYYYFEQTGQGEKMIITDAKVAHSPISGAPPVQYTQVKGLDLPAKDEVAVSFVCEQTLAPKNVVLKDYNYRIPGVDLKSEAEVMESGLGQVYMYGDNFKTLDEGGRLATVRAEQIRSRQTMFTGKSTAPFLRAGYLFSMSNHYRSSFNADYLAEEVRHEGDQTRYLLAGLGHALTDREAKMFYRNTFTAIPADVQYRPELKTQKARFHGQMTATVDAESDGKYAFLDEQGRYKVRLPFDLAGAPEGKASSWLRMAQPYGGAGHGMHFPLLKGTEVLLSFIDGDVDRPIISAAMPNFEDQSIVKDRNAPANAIRSAAGNQIVLGDKEGQEFVGMYSPFSKSGIAIGSHEPGGGGSIGLSTEGGIYEVATNKNSVLLGSEASVLVGLETSITGGIKTELNASISNEVSLSATAASNHGPRFELGSESMSLLDESALVGLKEVEISAGISKEVSGYVQQAKKALRLGVAGGLVGSLGVAAACAPFDEELTEGKLEWVKNHGNYFLGFGAAGASFGALLSLASWKQIRDVVKAYEKASNDAKTASIHLDKRGVAVKVNSKVKKKATLSLEVDKEGPESTQEQKSVIMITKEGESIKLWNLAKGYFVAEDESVAIGVGTPYQSDSLILLSEEDVEIKFANGGKLYIDDDSATLSSNRAQGGQFISESRLAEVKCGSNNYIKVSNTGLELKGAKFEATVTGAYTINGSTIKLG